MIFPENPEDEYLNLFNGLLKVLDQANWYSN